MEDLVQKLISNGTLKTQSIIEAFRTVDRRLFVPEDYADEAYGDYPLAIGYGQTISQPSTVAFMLELLGARAGNRVLDIGSGSGWTTALLAHIVGPHGHVIGLEIVDELVTLGRSHLEHYHFTHAHIEKADPSTLGLPQKEPFDRILVSAAAQHLPHTLTEQLKVSGVLVIPVKNSIWKITRVSVSKFDKEQYEGYAFVPLI